MYSKKINQLATNLNPQSTDLIPIGDATTGQLKTTTFGEISGISGDGIISGGIVTWTGTGLVFNISACTYVLNGIRYSSAFTTKTLAAADPTNDRIDVFAVNTSGQVVVIQGTPSANPVEPQVDVDTELQLTNVTITAASSTPTQVITTKIYDENQPLIDEWTMEYSIGVSYTNNASYTGYTAYKGTYSWLTSKTATSYVSLRWTKNPLTYYNVSDYTNISFAVRITNAIQDADYIKIWFLDSGNTVLSNKIELTSKYGFNPNLLNTWQFITIPIADFKILRTQFTKIILYWNQPSVANSSVGYDFIRLQGGIVPNSTNTLVNFGFVQASSGSASSTIPSDTLNVVGTGLITTSATGKTLTIASNQIATSSILGRVTAGTGNIETLTGTQATTLLNVFTSSLKGLAPASGGGTTNFLRADGTWAAAGGSMAIGGSITSATAGSVLFAGTSGVLQQDNANFFWDDTNNRLGIGTSTPSAILHSVGSVTAASAIARGNYMQPTLVAAANSDVLVGLDINPTFTNGAFTGVSNYALRLNNTSATGVWNIYASGTANNYMAGALGIGSTSLSIYNLRIQKNITGGTIALGISNESVVQSDVTSQARYYDTTASTAAASFTLNQLFHYRAAQGTLGASSIVNNQIGFSADASLIGAGLNIGFQGSIPSGTTRFNIYMDGTANNYLAGALGIGSTSLTGYNIRIDRALTGATTVYGIANFGTILSDVTTKASYFSTYANTQNTVFTLSDLYHYESVQPSFGSSTVTNQYGYFVGSSLTGATNNYGIYGNIASGTGRWNLYMNGTAANYMNGNLLLGTTTDSGYRLDVNGTARVSGLITASAGVQYTRLNPTTTTTASTATLTPDISIGDLFTITAQAVGLSVANPTGTPVEGQKMIIRIEDNGTARAITWSGTQYRASTDLPLPTTTILNKTMYLGFIYNSTDTKWDLIAFLNNF